MLQPIYLPEHIEIEGEEGNSATFSIHPYHPGYGPTVANALRRVLLSSLPGAAITQIKVDGIDHEFTAKDGIQEDIVSLILNLKRVRLKLTGKDPVEIRLQVNGEQKVTAGDFKTPPEVEIVNPEQPIMVLTDKDAKIDLRCTVESGRGYFATEDRADDAREIGTIAIDAVFTPVQRVSFKVDNVRVGQVTDYHKLMLTIVTDGTISPKEALQQAAAILADHFTELAQDWSEKLTADRPVEVVPVAPVEEPQEPENTLNLLQLPSRVHNALERVGITTVEQVLELTDEQIQDIPGLGAKAVDDIAKARDDYSAKSPAASAKVE